MRADDRFAVLERYFAGLAEHTFEVRLGVADPGLIDYLTHLLMRFIRNDAVYRVRDVTGRSLDDVVRMFLEAEHRVGNARREVHRHIGDFTLFWAGVYPEALERRKQSAEARSETYAALGKRSYFIASTIETDDDADAPADILERLSHRFELCAYGLREVRRQWEERDDGIPPQTFLIN
jgi:hypothetical protein